VSVRGFLRREVGAVTMTGLSSSLVSAEPRSESPNDCRRVGVGISAETTDWPDRDRCDLADGSGDLRLNLPDRRVGGELGMSFVRLWLGEDAPGCNRVERLPEGKVGVSTDGDSLLLFFVEVIRSSSSELSTR
jgi:hypothetical protein